MKKVENPWSRGFKTIYFSSSFSPENEMGSLALNLNFIFKFKTYYSGWTVIVEKDQLNTQVHEWLAKLPLQEMFGAIANRMPMGPGI